MAYILAWKCMWEIPLVIVNLKLQHLVTLRIPMKSRLVLSTQPERECCCAWTSKTSYHDSVFYFILFNSMFCSSILMKVNLWEKLYCCGPTKERKAQFSDPNWEMETKKNENTWQDFFFVNYVTRFRVRNVEVSSRREKNQGLRTCLLLYLNSISLIKCD